MVVAVVVLAEAAVFLQRQILAARAELDYNIQSLVPLHIMLVAELDMAAVAVVPADLVAAATAQEVPAVAQQEQPVLVAVEVVVEDQLAQAVQGGVEPLYFVTTQRPQYLE
jgi:hypothetical protein